MAGFCGTYDETADAVKNMLSSDPCFPEDWDGQYDNGIFAVEFDTPEEREGLETIDYVRATYDEICEQESRRNGGVLQVYHV